MAETPVEFLDVGAFPVAFAVRDSGLEHAVSVAGTAKRLARDGIVGLVADFADPFGGGVRIEPLAALDEDGLHP